MWSNYESCCNRQEAPLFRLRLRWNSLTWKLSSFFKECSLLFSNTDANRSHKYKILTLLDTGHPIYFPFRTCTKAERVPDNLHPRSWAWTCWCCCRLGQRCSTGSHELRRITLCQCPGCEAIQYCTPEAFL